MSVLNSLNIELLAEQIVERLTIEIEASGRHVHLSRPDLEALFGAGYQLNRTRDLSQPGQFACAERVTLEGPKGRLDNVVILGPERSESQVEISLTDAVVLGLTPPVRGSGDTAGTPGITLRHGDRVLRLDHGLIAARRHIHVTPEDARRFGVTDKQRVRLRCFTSRPLVFEDVEVRVSPKFSTVVHIDYDEANACGFRKGDRGLILKSSGGTQMGGFGRVVTAPFGASQAFCRKQNLKVNCPEGAREGTLGCDAGRIHCAAVGGFAALRMRRTPCGCFARADKISGVPAKSAAFCGGTEANACGFRKGDRGLILQ